MRSEFLYHKRSGFTLVEVLVGSVVLSMFIMLALGAIVPSYKVVREAEESVSAQREVVMAFDRLVAEMANLDRASVTVIPGALAFLSDEEYRGTNPAIPDSQLVDINLVNPVLAWRKTVVFRHRDNQLWRREYPYDKANAVWVVAPDKLATLADIPNRQEKIYAKNVELFEANLAGKGRVLVKLRSVFRQTNRPAACELQLQIEMRGGR